MIVPLQVELSKLRAELALVKADPPREGDTFLTIGQKLSRVFDLQVALTSLQLRVADDGPTEAELSAAFNRAAGISVVLNKIEAMQDGLDPTTAGYLFQFTVPTAKRTHTIACSGPVSVAMGTEAGEAAKDWAEARIRECSEGWPAVNIKPTEIEWTARGGGNEPEAA